VHVPRAPPPSHQHFLFAATLSLPVLRRSQQELRQRECLTRTTSSRCPAAALTPEQRPDGVLELQHAQRQPAAQKWACIARSPHEPHFVHLSWAVRRLTRTQAKYIRLFYGADVLATLEAL